MFLVCMYYKYIEFFLFVDKAPSAYGFNFI